MGTKALVIATIYNRLKTIQGALSEVGWQVNSFQDPREALGSLRTIHYSAVFCDELVRGASVSGFLAWTRRVSPDLPFYVIGDMQSDKGRHGEPTDTLPFPPPLNALPRPKNPTEHETFHLPRAAGGGGGPGAGANEAPLSGNTSLVSLSGLLEMMGLAGQNGLVELGAAGREGLLYLENGKILHAETPVAGYASLHGDDPSGGGAGLKGLGALAHILSLSESDFRVLPYRAPARSLINLPVSNALTEAARLSDERRRYEGLMSALKEACPAITAVTVGYLLSASPSATSGEAEGLFGTAKDLLAGRTLGKVRALYLALEREALALRTFGDDNVMVAKAPLNARRALFNALEDLPLGGEH